MTPLKRTCGWKIHKARMVKVNVTEGLLEGEFLKNSYGGEYYSFKGIPYAEPPLGDLRFKAPKPPKPWTGVRKANKCGSVCYQYDSKVSDKPFGNEDCLYLNVYTPELKPKKPLPVMAWIHGGAFMWGGGNDDLYGPEFLIRHGVILITINYRLEVLGFLCLDTEDIPGNAGMKDQVQALRWIKKNIKNFGGDPDNITIFGESAGAGSVSFHLISPMTKGIFKRAIIQSGAATCWWSQCFEPRERALVLAKQLGFYSEDDKALYEFFKNQPLEALVNVQLPVIKSHKPYEINLAIANEKEFPGIERFFYGDIPDIMKKKIHEGVDVITGYTEDEGLMAFGLSNPTLELFIHSCNSHLEFLVPKTISNNCSIKTQLEVGRKIKHFYFKNALVSEEDKDSLLQFLAMDMFNHGIILQAKILTKSNRNVYFYKFGCKSERNIVGHFLGLSSLIGEKTVVCHADDLSYLFTNQFMASKVDMNSATFVMIDRFTKLWTNFAKYGNPTPDESLGVKWSPFTIEEQNYLEIGNELACKTNPDIKEIQFWEDIFKKYLPQWTP